MLRRLFIALTILFITSTALAAEHSPRLAAALDSLDRTIDSRSEYVSTRMRQIDSLRHAFNEIPADRRTVDDYIAVAAAYQSVLPDSAYRYLAQAYRMADTSGDRTMRDAVLVRYADILNATSLSHSVISTLDSIDAATLPVPARMNYYSAMAQAYINTAEHQPWRLSTERMSWRASEYLDSLKTMFREGGTAWRITDAQIQYLKGHDTMGLGELNELFDETTPDDQVYATLTALLARYYSTRPNRREDYMYYLTLSAISDIRSVNNNPSSIVALARAMYDEGDIDRAFRYLNVASSSIGGLTTSRLSGEILSTLIGITDDMKRRETNAELMSYALIIIFAAIAATIFIYTRKVNRRRQRLNNRIDEHETSISQRDAYINQLLNMCSVYVEGLEEFSRFAARKLKVGQAKDLYDSIESGRFSQELTDRFFTVFDSAVLSMYPRFVDELNALLMPDKRIKQSGDRLSPELRIIAFMRLGVNDSQRISKFLGLSLNTIYTYRNNMRSRAVDRENFENDIMKIGKNGHI